MAYRCSCRSRYQDNQFQLTPPTLEEKTYIRFLVYSHFKLSIVYYLQTLSLWIRVKHRFEPHHFRYGLAMCLNIALHFLGPQGLCKHINIFKPSNNMLFSKQGLRNVHESVLGYVAASHLDQWQIARTVQWYIVLNILDGRIQ